MARGDQIYVMRPLAGMDELYQHHGIDCGDGTVIHYRKGDQATISRTSFASFAKGKPVFVKSQPVSFIPDVVIQRAESRLDEQNYNLLTNNCEHFATWCKTGRNESLQLLEFGLDGARWNTAAIGQLLGDARQTADPVQAEASLKEALHNIAIAHAQLEPQYRQAQQAQDTWHRVAQLALKQGREDLARAALAKKVSAKRQTADLAKQLAQLNDLQGTLRQPNHWLGANPQPSI
ncbi:MAG TPA: lecithin retinol acyltransferase family protein [Chroococcidiopsis sp.]